jgi:hypothetical protein
MANRKEETSEETTDSSSDGIGVACNPPIVRCDSVGGETCAGKHAARMSVQRSDSLPSTEKYLAGISAADLPVLDVREAGRNRLRWRRREKR